MGNKRSRAGFPDVQLFLTQRLARLAGANSMRAIREGLLWLVPCLLVSALFLILSALAQMSGQPEPRGAGACGPARGDRQLSLIHI